MHIRLCVKNSRVLLYVFLFLASVLLCVEKVAAQPGDTRTPEQIRKDLNQRLDQANERISQYPSYADDYEYRGSIYSEFCQRSRIADEQTSYAEKAFADFTTAIRLQPSTSALAARARIRLMIGGESGKPPSLLEAWFRNFDGAISDYLEAIRVYQNFSTQNPSRAERSESPAPDLFIEISHLYLERAKAMSATPELLREARRLHKRYSYWSDFDTAIAYAQKGTTRTNDPFFTVSHFIDKGDAAYRLGEYKIALAAYDAAEDYWNKRCVSVTENRSNLCDISKKGWDDTFNTRRARVYLKLKKWETALTYLNRYLGQFANTFCPAPYLVRARVYRQIGRIDNAVADEQTAGRLPIPPVSCYGTEEDWK